MKFIIHVFILALLWMGSLAYAKNGHLFNVTETGDPVLLDINLCLNGKGPYACERYRISAMNLSLTTTTKHDYPAAGIKVLSSNYKPSNCRQIANGYCLFSVSHTQSAVIKLDNLQKKEQRILLNSTPPATPMVGDSYTLTATGGGSGNAV
ncbi:hypothetical protein, partial [Legionella sp.]|uniref:hypothetical protein n=1 Tax=Legionella sp. TaxID=459 RepID=UPI003D119446